MDDDHTLLSRFAKAKDETAFTELVRRHLDLVYGVCLRRTGSRSLAEELVQNVFASLARKAGSLKPEVLVVGWLHRAAHLESLSAFRSESTRLRKMKNYMDFQSDADPEPDRFREISPFLDQALDSLPPSDRDVVLLRFASDLTLQQIGNRLGKSESAAQRHLQRVLEKLAVILRRRGVTTSATALTLMLGADFAKAAPASLTVAFVSKTAIASAAAGGFTLIKLTTLLYIMKNKAIIITSVCLLAAGGSAVYISTRPSASLSSSSAVTIAKDLATDSVTAISKDPSTSISEKIAVNSPGRRPRPVSEYQDLEAKFGASRVRLVKSATDSFMKMADTIVSIQEFKFAQEGKEGKEGKGPRVKFNLGMDGTDDPLSSVPGLILSAEQKTQVEAMEARLLTKKMESLSVIQSGLVKSRTNVMELMLSSDAANRGEMSITDFQAVLDHQKELLVSVEAAFPAGDTIQHQMYRSDLPSILDQDQMAVFEKFRSEQAAAGGQVTDLTLGPLGIRMVSDGPKADAQTLEQIDEDLRKGAKTCAAMLKVIEAALEN